MFVEEYTNKHGNTVFRYVERYTDPLTNKRKQVSITLNKNGRQSHKEAQKRLNMLIEDKLNKEENVSLDRLTFHKACDEYLDHYKKTSGSKQSTIKNIESQIKSIKEHFDKDILATKMNASIIQKQLNNWKVEVTSHHLNRMRITIILVFRYIKSYYGYTDISFIEDIKVPKKAKTHEEIEIKRNKYLTDDEIKELLQLFDDEIEQIKHGKSKALVTRVKDLVEFQILNGLRVGEALAIKNENIDLDNKKLTISGTISWQTDKTTGMYGVKDTTKTQQSYRIIDLSDRSISILKKIMLENKTSKAWNDEYNNASEFVFTTSTGSPVYIHKINKLLKTVTDKSSFKHKNITSHALRHTHITTLASLGLPLKAIMERVGHTSEKTTIQLYTHVTDQMAQDLINKLNEHEKKVI